MTPTTAIFLLRLLNAFLLLSFLGTLAWLIYRDVRLTNKQLNQSQRLPSQLIVIVSEDDSLPIGSVYPLLPVTSIGRSTSNLVTLDNNYTSGEHALITRRGDMWWLEDLDSRNGTLLNGILLTEATIISPGDVITIGNTQFKFERPSTSPNTNSAKN